jgi:uncharacterized protein YvpB
MRALLLFLVLSGLLAEAKDFRGSQFIGFERFDAFQRTLTEGALVLVSPKIEAAIEWDELVASWNLRGAPDIGLEIEAKAIYPARETKWYNLGRWSLEPRKFPRESVRRQQDRDGTVDTDTLKLKERTRAVQLRITVRGTNGVGALNFLGLCFHDSTAPRSSIPPDQKTWGTLLEVPERSQTNYPEGISEWCSPTSVSMMLSYWSAKLNRPELSYDVPEVARNVNDPNWPGTGNWPFNTAFAGAHSGIRAYVARLGDVAELEQWVRASVPVAISVKYGWLKGREDSGNGHLVVCIGFDKEGNGIFNDPGRSAVRQTYSRANVIKAWAASGNTVYLIYPENLNVPNPEFGRWYLGPPAQ